MREAAYTVDANPESLRTPSRVEMQKNPTVRDVAIVLVVKTLIVVAAAIFVFGPSARPHVDAASVSALIVAEPPTNLHTGSAEND